MNMILWPVVTLAAFDGLILIVLYLVLRRSAPLDRSNRWIVGGGLASFAVQALIFYSDAILTLHLATMVGVFAICLWAPRRLPEP